MYSRLCYTTNSTRSLDCWSLDCPEVYYTAAQRKESIFLLLSLSSEHCAEFTQQKACTVRQLSSNPPFFRDDRVNGVTYPVNAHMSSALCHVRSRTKPFSPRATESRPQGRGCRLSANGSEVLSFRPCRQGANTNQPDRLAWLLSCCHVWSTPCSPVPGRIPPSPAALSCSSLSCSFSL